jgi:hypothetical protein
VKRRRRDIYRKVRSAIREAAALRLSRKKGGRALVLAARRTVPGAASMGAA